MIGFFVVDRDEVHNNPEAIADALKCYSSEGDGAYVWVIPDGYMAGTHASGTGMGTTRWRLFLTRVYLYLQHG